MKDKKHRTLGQSLSSPHLITVIVFSLCSQYGADHYDLPTRTVCGKYHYQEQQPVEIM